jgi:hypothetical protein
MNYSKIQFSKIWNILIILITTIIIFPTANLNAKLIAKFTLHSENFLPANTPISVQLKNIPISTLRLEKIEDSNRYPIASQIESQIESGNSSRLWWVLITAMKAGETRSYELLIENEVQAPLVCINMDDQTLELNQNKRKALRYQHALMPPPKNENILYTRSGFIHPIWTPDGKVLTRIHPSDHIHHMGFWHPWTKTEFEGHPVDFWNLNAGQGTVRFVKFNSTQTGTVFGSFEVFQEHVDLSAQQGEKVVLNEKWLVRLWTQLHPEESYWMWDFSTTQSCATQSPLKLFKYRYGGFGFRGTSDWNEKNSDYLTSEGKTRKDGNGTRARWCNAYGTTDKGPAGVLILSHISNYEHPEPMRIWPQGDVFFGFCPVVNKDWTLEPGQDYLRRYRLIVYDGTMTSEKAEQFWRSYVNPPQVDVQWNLKGD